MKLQHLAIVFIIIILPITIVLSAYIGKQIDTINLQNRYSGKLQNATYDAIKAFQLNTINNKYSTVSDSKIRDIEASISTFYNSLGTELGASGETSESLQQYIPAIVYTLYDGYYIYGKYYNESKAEYQYGLKPYIYYSCRYVKGSNNDFVINYTLDNTITIYGKVNGEYVTKSGALINPDMVNVVSNQLVTYDKNTKSIRIEPEILEEQLALINSTGAEVEPVKYYEYTVYQNRKVYYDKDANAGEKYFWNSSNKKQVITDKETLDFVRSWTSNDGQHLYNNSAIEYYTNAKIFSQWVKENLSGITQANAVDENLNQITDFSVNTNSEAIFNLSNENDPMVEASTFNQNRISVIRRVIQTTLNAAIANYSSSAEYEFVMPVFSEEDWDKIVNNISVATFMQGIPIGSKYYNNYCIVTNNKNKEFVSKESIYIITDDNNNNELENTDEVHSAASKDVIDSSKKVIAAYKNIDFELQTVVITEGNERYYYPHANEKCYECMINTANTYSIDDLIHGIVKVYNVETESYEQDTTKSNSDSFKKLRKIYLTALARERQMLYKTNSYFDVQ